MKPKIKHPKTSSRNHPRLNLLADLVGEFIEYWGFKKVQGRMWCYLFLIEEPLNSRQLAQLLDISPALVTQSVQVLLRYQLIWEEKKGPNGVLRFQANPNVAEAVAAVLSMRETLLLEKAHSAQKLLAGSSELKNKESGFAVDRQRVKQIGQWISLARKFLDIGVSSLENPGNPFEEPGGFRIHKRKDF